MCTKSKEPESQTKYSLKNKMRTKKKKKRLDIYTSQTKKKSNLRYCAISKEPESQTKYSLKNKIK